MASASSNSTCARSRGRVKDDYARRSFRHPSQHGMCLVVLALVKQSTAQMEPVAVGVVRIEAHRHPHPFFAFVWSPQEHLHLAHLADDAIAIGVQLEGAPLKRLRLFEISFEVEGIFSGNQRARMKNRRFQTDP